MNALKHGLHARTKRAMEKVEQESGVDFMAVLEDMYMYFQPMDPLEHQLVRRIARCAWRLRLAEAMELRCLDRQPGPTRPGTSYDKVLKYERLVDIHLHRAIAAFQRKRQLMTTPDRRPMTGDR
jgi:hypothetical protein